MVESWIGEARVFAELFDSIGKERMEAMCLVHTAAERSAGTWLVRADHGDWRESAGRVWETESF